MKLLIGLVLFCASFIEEAETQKEFEGRINFKVEFESKDSRIDKKDLEKLFGVKKEFFYKNGKYKWVTRKGITEFELYNYSLDSLNTISKKSSSDTLFFNNFTNSTDSILSIDSLDIIKICNIECQGIRFKITNEKGIKITRTLYFPINSLRYPKNYYVNQKGMCNNFIHQYGGSIPLRLEVDMDFAPFKMIYTASKITAMEIDDSELIIDQAQPQKHR